MSPHIFTNKLYYKLKSSAYAPSGSPSISKRTITNVLQAIENKNDIEFIKSYDLLVSELKNFTQSQNYKNLINAMPLLGLLFKQGMLKSIEYVFNIHFPSYSKNDVTANRKTKINLTKFLTHLWPSSNGSLDANGQTKTEGVEVLKYFMESHPLASELIEPCYEIMFMKAVNSMCWPAVEYLVSSKFTPQIKEFNWHTYVFLVQMIAFEKIDLVETIAENLNRNTRLDIIEELEKKKNNKPAAHFTIYENAAVELLNLLSAGLEKKKLLAHIKPFEKEQLVPPSAFKV